MPRQIDVCCGIFYSFLRICKKRKIEIVEKGKKRKIRSG